MVPNRPFSSIPEPSKKSIFRFSLPNLRFGKLDVGKYAREGELFRVNSSAASRQLPTIALFRGGLQTERRPLVGQNRRAIPFVFTEVVTPPPPIPSCALPYLNLQENTTLALDLSNVYEECKKGKLVKKQQ
jgi:hypothetical protein